MLTNAKKSCAMKICAFFIGMKMILVAITLILCAVNTLHAQKVEFRGTEAREFSHFALKDTTLTINGKKEDRNQLSQVIFASPQKLNADDIPHKQFATSQLMAIAKTMVSEYPQAEGITLFDNCEITLNSDGTKTYRYHTAEKIVRNTCLDWGTRTFFLDEGRSHTNIIFARNILPEGTVLYANTNEIKVTPVAEDDVSFGYGNIATLTLPGVREGSIVEFVWEEHVYNPDDTSFFNDNWFFGSDNPVYSSDFSLCVPKSKKISYLVEDGANGEHGTVFFESDALEAECQLSESYKKLPIRPQLPFKPSVFENDTLRIFVWHIEKLPPVVSEPKMPSLLDVIPAVHVSTAESWDAVFNWLGKFQKARIQPDDAIRTKVAELISNKQTLEEKIDALYRFCQREILYISIKGSVSSDETGHKAEETFAAGYGDCTDKSALFCAMLSAIDIEAHPIIIMTNDERDVQRCIPNTAGNHAITRVILPNGTEMFLDATSTTHKFPYFRTDDQGVTFVDALGKKTGTTSTNTPKQNLQTEKIAIEIAKDFSAHAQFLSKPFGMAEADFRSYWEYFDFAEYERIFADWMTKIFPACKLDTFAVAGIEDLDKEFYEYAEVDIPQAGFVANELLVLPLFEIEKIFDDFTEIATAKRRFAIEYDAPRCEETSITILLPNNVTFDKLPQNYTSNCADYATFDLKFSQLTQGKIEVKSVFELKKRTIPAEDFAKYRAFILDARRVCKTRLLAQISTKH